MAPSTPVPETARYTFESQARECYGRVAYSHKTHEKMAEQLSQRLRTVKWVQIVLASLTAGGAVGVLFAKESPWLPLATAVLSIASLIANSYMKDLDPGAEAQRHREVASDLWAIRESYLSLLTDIRDGSTGLDGLRARRDELQVQLHKIYKNAPHTDATGYAQAQVALKENEELTFSDAEIDAFLPKPLQRSK